MSGKSGPSAATTSDYSSRNQSQPIALEYYLTSPPTITETLAFPASTEGTSSNVDSKGGEMKEALDRWQSAWDSTKESKK
ncbi:hypothetical protein F4820DRAFT_326167 [Hypoxylon rubiginosum]|uniref:Uncharacterized protein n=1 Tax=Hypoxylon rubiginosum TaxID=110542 RepID=A0ACB9YZ65_9PEZI|nr:hypothetical protein F4820DRAFT_326167 [Hypoxylon rubiginosum]